MFKSIVAIVSLLVWASIELSALTAKRNPGSNRGADPACNPDVGEKISEVAGPRQCYCYESQAGWYENLYALWPIGIYGMLFHHNQKVVSCEPEQITSTSYTCTYRNDCWSDYEEPQVGWWWEFGFERPPVFMVEEDRRNWP